MKLICDHCGAASSPRAIRVEGDEIVLTCAQCGRESTASTGVDEPAADEPGVDEPGADESAADEPGVPVDAADDGQAEADRGDDDSGDDDSGDGDSGVVDRDAPTLPPVKCPRCFHRQATADFCHRCGLDLSLDDIAVTDWDDIPDDKQEAHARAREMWARIEASPDDADRHERFVEHCTEHRLLTFAVRRYREYLSDHDAKPTFVEYRDRAVHKLETMAMTMLTSDRWSEGVARRVATAKLVLTIIAVVLLIAGLVLLVFVFKEKGTLSPSAF